MNNYTNPPYYLTAYGIAVKHGYQGTEAEWIDMMQTGAKQSAEAAKESETDAKAAQAAAEAARDLAAAWAAGEGAGIPGATNNAAYYAGQASDHATSAAGSVEDAQAWATGKRGEEDVPGDDPAYHNNAKYYADAAASEAESAAAEAAAAVTEDVLGEVPGIIADWIEEHEVPVEERVVVIDDSLSVSGAAADAAKTGEIRTALLRSEVGLIDDDLYKINAAITQDTGKWSIGTLYSIIFPVSPGVQAYIQANDDYYTTYCALTEYSTPVAGEAAPLADGYEAAVKIDSGGSATIQLPADARYICINVGASPVYMRMPVRAIVDGRDMLSPIWDNVRNKERLGNNLIQALGMQVRDQHNLIAFSPDGVLDAPNEDNAEIYYSSGLFALNRSEAGDSSTRIRLTTELSANTSVRAWDDGIMLVAGKTYVLDAKIAAGTVTHAEGNQGFAPVVYKLGSGNSLGTMDLSEGHVTRTFVAPDEKINIALYLYSTALFDHCTGYITLRLAGQGESDNIEPYFEAEMSDTLDKVRASITEPAAVFLHATDIHRYSSDRHQTFSAMIQNMRYFAQRVKCDFATDCGDLTDGKETAANTIGYVQESLAEYLSVGLPYFFVTGNHDTNRYYNSGSDIFTIQKMFELYYPATKNAVFNYASDNCCTDYYFDIPTLGVRCIFINACNQSTGYTYRFGPSTATWLTGALDTDSTVLLFTHVSPVKEHVYANSAADPAPSGQSRGPIKQALKDFVDAGGNLIMLTGHSHVDGTWVSPYLEITQANSRFGEADLTESGYAAMTGMIDGLDAPERTEQTATEDLWSVCVYKPHGNEIDLIRFGAGADRYIHATPLRANTAVTSRLDEPSWSSTNVDLATVSNGAITITGMDTGRCAVVAKDSAGNAEIWIVEVS